MTDADASDSPASRCQSLWSQLRPARDGLVAAVVQHARSGQVLMLGYMNQEALAATLRSRRVTFYSRSRARLWEKGETSGNTLDLAGADDIWADCDGDALLVLATPRGPTCHTARDSCFYRRLRPRGAAIELSDEPGGPSPARAHAIVAQLFATILERKAGRGLTHREGRSYVRSLLDRGVPKIAAKIREEADELCVALADESDARVTAEAADLMFHALVGLACRDVSLDAVAEVLQRRAGISGIDEKAARREA